MNASIFAVPAANPPLLGAALAEALGLELTRHEAIGFYNDNMMVQLPTDRADRTSVIVVNGARNVGETILETALLADALRRAGCRTIVAVLAYLPYSRSNRLDRRGISLGCRVLVDQLEASQVDRFVMFDLHARESLGLFRKPAVQVSALPLLSAAVPSGDHEVVIGPDRGRYDDCRDLSDLRKTPFDLLLKIRKDDSGVSEVMSGTSLDLRGSRILLYDDEITRGETALHTIDHLVEGGVEHIDFVTVYDFASPEVRERVLSYPQVGSFVTTNLGLPATAPLDGYVVIDAAPQALGELDLDG